jgi:hypothetical protein
VRVVTGIVFAVLLVAVFFWAAVFQFTRLHARNWPTVPGSVRYTEKRKVRPGDDTGHVTYWYVGVGYVHPADGLYHDFHTRGPRRVVRRLKKGDQLTVSVKPGAADSATIRWRVFALRQ